MESTLARIITLAVNDFGYGDTTNNFIVNWVHPLLLKDHYEYIKEYKPKWNQAMNCPFEDEYWQAECTELENLEGMGD